MQTETLETRVRRCIRNNNLISQGEKLVVGVSGGADSVCLLHVLAGIREEFSLGLHIAHLNHQLRGEASEADAGYVLALARSMGIPATVARRDVTAYKTEHRLSLEEAAREVRYTFLSEVAGSVGASHAAVGHTRDDNVETILLHLIRGTGTRGLRGLQASSQLHYSGRKLTVIRPLLEVSRKETAEYCEQRHLSPRLDASNLSLSPQRNRIRHQLLPMLRSYNPRITEALLRTASIAAEDLDFINTEIARRWDTVASERENAVALDRKAFLELPPALKRHVLLIAIEKLVGSPRDIEMRHVKEVLEALGKPAGKTIDLPGGLVFAIDYDRYLVAHDASALVPFPVLSGEVELEVPGETALPGWRVETAIIEPSRLKAEPRDILIAYLDADKAGGKLFIRPRRAGDRFQPLGMSQPKKLGEFMIDAKVPRAWRERLPIAASPEHILWVVGWRIDERAKVTDATKRVLRLEFKRV